MNGRQEDMSSKESLDQRNPPNQKVVDMQCKESKFCSPTVVSTRKNHEIWGSGTNTFQQFGYVTADSEASTPLARFELNHET